MKISISKTLVKYITLITMLCASCFIQAHDIHKDNGAKQYQNKAIPKISVQLWSVKHELKADFKGT